MKQIITFLALICAITVNAQIAYQVSLLNKATGEPRANETVNVDVRITDSKDNIIFSGSQSATTNDFGVLSLSVGNEDTFNNVDWNNLPLFVSASVDNVLLGRSQILSVPVAEHAKHTGSLTKKILKSKTWKGKWSYGSASLTFSDSKMTFTGYYDSGSSPVKYTHSYRIYGDFVITYSGSDHTGGGVYYFIPDIMYLVIDGTTIYK